MYGIAAGGADIGGDQSNIAITEGVREMLINRFNDEKRS
jgi:hypothetical protein